MSSKSKRFLSILLCAIMTLVLVAGCTQTEAPDDGADKTPGTTDPGKTDGSDTAKQKDRIIFARPIDSDNLDPVTNQFNQNIWVLENLTEGLVAYSDDGTAMEPRLATDWSTSEDGLVWTFNLREGIKFADGTPVTGEDWEFSFQRCIDHTESIFYTYAAAIEKVEAPSDTQFVITLKQSDPSFLTSLGMCSMKVISKAYFEANGGEDGVADGVLGTGPYYIKDWNKGTSLLLAKNEHYWQEGLPKTNEVELKVVPEAETRNMMLKAGEADIISEVPIANMADLDAEEGLSALAIDSTQTRYFIINHRHEPFDNPKVREAVRYALDLQQIIDICMLGNAEPATSYIHKASQFFNEDLPVPKQDIAKAKELLAEAGFENGFTFDYLVISGDDITQQIATVAKEQLAAAGMIANIVVEENASFREKFANNGITFYVGQWTLQSNDPASPSDYWWIYEQADAYMSGYKNARLTEINALAKSEMDPEVRGEYFKEMQQTFYDDIVAIPLWWGKHNLALSDKVKDFIQVPYGYYRFMYMTATE